MAVSRIVMQRWSEDYSAILLRSGLRLPLLTSFVDDGRQGSTALRLGMVYSREERKFIVDMKQEKIDRERREPNM